jgi:hypothetical protein
LKYEALQYKPNAQARDREILGNIPSLARRACICATSKSASEWSVSLTAGRLVGHMFWDDHSLALRACISLLPIREIAACVRQVFDDLARKIRGLFDGFLTD